MTQLKFRNMRNSGCNSPNLVHNPMWTWVNFFWPYRSSYHKWLSPNPILYQHALKKIYCFNSVYYLFVYIDLIFSSTINKYVITRICRKLYILRDEGWCCSHYLFCRASDIGAGDWWSYWPLIIYTVQIVRMSKTSKSLQRDSILSVS